MLDPYSGSSLSGHEPFANAPHGGRNPCTMNPSGGCSHPKPSTGNGLKSTFGSDGPRLWEDTSGGLSLCFRVEGTENWMLFEFKGLHACTEQMFGKQVP